MLRFIVLIVAIADPFGPSNCVSINRSDHGTCILRTACDGIDTSDFEFAFVCATNDGNVRKHTFGQGGFDDEEEYDTGVHCDTCSPPGVDPKEILKSYAAAGTPKTQHPPPAEAAFYGPGGCVTTYRSADGTCIIQTRCTAQDISHYDVGLTCIDFNNSGTRHLFGINSFDSEETFDTLIQCSLCLGLDSSGSSGSAAVVNATTNTNDTAAPEAESVGNDTWASVTADVSMLKGEVKDLKDEVKEIVDELNAAPSMLVEKEGEHGATEAVGTTQAPKKSHAFHHRSKRAEARPASQTDTNSEDDKNGFLTRRGHHRSHHRGRHSRRDDEEAEALEEELEKYEEDDDEGEEDAENEDADWEEGPDSSM